MKLPNSHIQNIQLPFLADYGIELAIKRDDLIHPFISGNKIYKLKENIVAALALSKTTIVTFGGAYSNHIAATAYAGKLYGLKTVGIIRGEELAHKWQDNETLNFAVSNGMKLEFINRELYKNKDTTDFLADVMSRHVDCYLIPEGGNNSLGVKGCEAILNTDTIPFHHVCVAVGTATTLAGLAIKLEDKQKLLGFSALKGSDFLYEDVQRYTTKKNYELIDENVFGGYGKVDDRLIQFINEFKTQTNILLDPIYTGKMMYRLVTMIKAKYFAPNTKILAIHTGGLQGIAGINKGLQAKNKPIINIL